MKNTGDNEGADGAALGARVHHRRLALGLSQRVVSERTGIHQPTISAIENGHVGLPLAATVLALADVLDVTTDWLYGRPGAPAPDGPTHNPEE